MEIERVTEQVLLSELKNGQCFERGDQICIKTNEADPDGDIITVELHTGDVHRFPPDNMVTPVNAMIKTF